MSAQCRSYAHDLPKEEGQMLERLLLPVADWRAQPAATEPQEAGTGFLNSL